MSEDPHQPLVPRSPAPSRDPLVRMGHKVARVALAAAWGAHHPWERFTRTPAADRAERGWYRSSDGWECPLYRIPARPGAAGTPVVLLHGALLARRAFHLHDDTSLAKALVAAGHEVWMPGHRGDAEATPPDHPTRVDFDEVLACDLPAAVERIRALSGARRMLWIGHGLGGQLLWAHLATGGRDTVAAGVALGAPLLFAPPASRARSAGQIARLRPEDWSLPLQAVARALSPTGTDRHLSDLARQLDGPARRRAMVHAVAELRTGFVRQADTWLRAGRLVDRHDRRDYLGALAGCRVPMLAIGSEDDPRCPPAAARAPVIELAPGAGAWHNLGPGWGHADLLLGTRAAAELHPRVLDWLSAHADACWQPAPHGPGPTPLDRAR